MPVPSSPTRRLTIVATAALTLITLNYAVRRARPALHVYTYTDFLTKPNELARHEMPAIIFLGSSRAKYALVPDEFTAATHSAAFNLAIADAKPFEWQLLIRRYLIEDRASPALCGTGFQPVPPRSPDLVILGVNASEFRADTLPSHSARKLLTMTDLAESWYLEGPSFDVFAESLSPRLGPIVPLLNLRREIKLAMHEKLAATFPKHAQAAREVRERVARPCPPNGYQHPWQLGRELRSIEERLLINANTVLASSTPLFDPHSATFRRMEDLLNLLRKHHIQVLVTYIPNSPRTEARWHSVEPAMIDAIAATCARCSVPFLPCPQSAIPRTNADYMEETHVGFPLAQRITRRVAQQSIALGMIKNEPTHLAQTSNNECPE